MRIIVNGREVDWSTTDISYSQVAAVAGCRVNKVSYSGKKGDGTLIMGESIGVYDGMIFNAGDTSRA